MLTLYFVSNYKFDENLSLTEDGFIDSNKLRNYLSDKGVTNLISANSKCFEQNLLNFSLDFNMEIEIDDSFNSTNEPIKDYKFIEYKKKQWENFNYCLEGNENFSEVLLRVNKGIDLLKNEDNKTYVISTNVEIISLILNHYEEFTFKDFDKLRRINPVILKLSFKENKFCKIKLIKEY